jgi:hypothetical protein
MEERHIEELRVELAELMRKQSEVLESRMLGCASDGDVLEYEIRQEIVHQLCNKLAHSSIRAIRSKPDVTDPEIENACGNKEQERWSFWRDTREKRLFECNAIYATQGETGGVWCSHETHSVSLGKSQKSLVTQSPQSQVGSFVVLSVLSENTLYMRIRASRIKDKRPSNIFQRIASSIKRETLAATQTAWKILRKWGWR